jgi:hypothetical protein
MLMEIRDSGLLDDGWNTRINQALEEAGRPGWAAVRMRNKGLLPALPTEEQDIALRKEVSVELCQRIAGGESMQKLTREVGMPDKSVFLKWCHDDPELMQLYHTALKMRAAGMAEELVDHCNALMQPGLTSEQVQAMKVVVNTKQWTMSRLLPRMYGDHQIVEHTGEVKMSDSQIDQKLNALLKRVKVE